jgi:hypothetical protein
MYHAELLALMHFLHPDRFSLADDFDLQGEPDASMRFGCLC